MNATGIEVRMTDVVIIGAGTAGLTAAIYAARAGKNVRILEEKMYGGQIVNSHKVENYPGFKEISGYDFANSLYEQAISQGAQFEFKKVESINVDGEVKQVITSDEIIECKYVIIAVGAKNRPLGIDNENKFVGKGISYCATCDGAFFRGQDVAVVGGGNTAIMDAKYLSGFCNKVYLIHRRDSFRGNIDEIKDIENIEIITNSIVKEIVATDYIEGIVIENKEIGNSRNVDVTGVFVAVGQIPDTKRFANILELDSNGYIVADETTVTGIKGVFAAGDCRTKELRQLVTAAADGAVAAERCV